MISASASEEAISPIYHRSPTGQYIVVLVRAGYMVLHAASGAPVASCEFGQSAAAVANSREWVDGQDAEEERRCRGA